MSTPDAVPVEVEGGRDLCRADAFHLDGRWFPVITEPNDATHDLGPEDGCATPGEAVDLIYRWATQRNAVMSSPDFVIRRGPIVEVAP